MFIQSAETKPDFKIITDSFEHTINITQNTFFNSMVHFDAGHLVLTTLS